MSTATAEVQVLTAAVRVLMVGSRQVTLSVYRQLDTIEPLHCEPFGRVNDSHNRYGSVYVVGADRRSGELVKSSLIDRVWTVHCSPKVFSETLPTAPGWCVDPDGLLVSCDVDPDRCGGYHVDDVGNLFEEMAYIRRANALVQRWIDLPLIVLAGLR